MPSSAPRPCSFPGCGALVRDGSRCEKHRRVEAKRFDAERGGANARGYTYRWQQASKAFLLEHPLCAKHQQLGELVAATLVDHTIPHKGDKSLFWQRSNWQPLCKPCHDLKTATEDSFFAATGPRG